MKLLSMRIKINPQTFFVFDLDDTLYREIDFLKSAYRHISKKLEPLVCCDLYEAMFTKFKKQENVFEWIIDTYGALEPQIDKTWLIKEYRSHEPELEISRDAADFLKQVTAKRVPAGLITDGRSATQRNKLKALGIATYFQDIIISEEFGSEKPDERNYLFFEKKYGVRDFYFFGDNLSKDFIIPARLGWKTICLLDNGDNIHKQIFENEHKIDYKISKFQEILLC